MQGSKSVLEYTDKEYYHNAVIKPVFDETFLENNTKNTRMVIDSKDRDQVLFPEPNKYEMAFDDDINDVVSVQLLSLYANISASYLINKYFNTLKFTVAATNYNCTLSIGDYTETSLATQIESKLNALIASNFKVIYNTPLDKYIICSKVAFSMDFNFDNSLAPMLGFVKNTYNSIVDASYDVAFTNVIVAPYRKNLDFNNYCAMYIEQFDVNKNPNKNLNKCFAIIGNNYEIMNISDDPMIIKYFNPPINKLNKLRISFFDRYGNPMDFQNTDHRFELMFKSFKQGRKYGHILKDM